LCVIIVVVFVILYVGIVVVDYMIVY